MNLYVQLLFWLFQVLNTPTALAMMLTPRRFHESTFTAPERVYPALGFASPNALAMLHNVLRGQGAALLAISLYLLTTGANQRSSFLLIALTCGLTFWAHVGTYRQHASSPAVMDALGKQSLRPMYALLAINAVVSACAFCVYATF